MNKTFLQALNDGKKNYNSVNELVIFEIIFYLSKNVKSKIDFIINSNNPIDFSFSHFEKLLKNYFKNQKPLAHIIGKTVFFSNEIIVCKKILAPRVETEILVEECLKILRNDERLHNILDLCCGTGNIGISLKKELPQTSISFLDSNKNAIKNVRINLQRHGIFAEVINKNFFIFLKKPKKFDAIICNPPYVATSELNRRMLKYESRISFINSEKPTDFYEAVLTNIKDLVSDTSHFLISFEASPFIKEEIDNIIKKINLTEYTKWFKDYSNNFRGFVIYKKHK